MSEAGANRARLLLAFSFLAFSSVFDTAVGYGAALTSKNEFGCCWKLW